MQKLLSKGLNFNIDQKSKITLDDVRNDPVLDTIKNRIDGYDEDNDMRLSRKVNALSKNTLSELYYQKRQSPS